MRIILHVSIQAQTLAEAVGKIGLIGQASVVLAGGAGTELQNLIAKIGLRPGLNCKCGHHIREMNTNGVEWCKQNVATISAWLREEAQGARLPFTEIGAKLLIRKAISNAKKKQNKETDMTVKLVIEIDEPDYLVALQKTKPAEGRVTAASYEPARPTPTAPQPKVNLAGQPVT